MAFKILFQRFMGVVGKEHHIDKKGNQHADGNGGAPVNGDIDRDIGLGHPHHGNEDAVHDKIAPEITIASCNAQVKPQNRQTEKCKRISQMQLKKKARQHHSQKTAAAGTPGPHPAFSNGCGHIGLHHDHGGDTRPVGFF